MHLEPFSLLTTGKKTVSNPTTPTLANLWPLSHSEYSRSGQVGVNQRGIFGYSCPDVPNINKNGSMTAFPPSKQSVVDYNHFGSPNATSFAPICFSAEPKTTPSTSSRRKKKSHQFPQNNVGPLSLSPSKSPLLGHPSTTNKRKNFFSGSYAFSGKQARGEKGNPIYGKLCIENIEKESGALEALPILVGNGASTNEISALPVDQERRTP